MDGTDGKSHHRYCKILRDFGDFGDQDAGHVIVMSPVQVQLGTFVHVNPLIFSQLSTVCYLIKATQALKILNKKHTLDRSILSFKKAVLQPQLSRGSHMREFITGTAKENLVFYL